MTDVAWTRQGSGPPLVLINGYAATAADWDPAFLDALGERSTIIRVDNVGVGASPKPPHPPTIASMAADARHVIEGLDIAPCAVLGWSMGGFIAQRLAADAAHCVSSVVLLSTDPGGDDAIQRDGAVTRRLFDHSGSPDARAERLISLLFPPDLAPSIVERFGEVVATAQGALDLDVVRAQEEAMDAWYAEDGPRPLEVADIPVLAAAGTDDAVIPVANVDALAALSGRAWTARFDGCGHAFMAQQPSRLAALVNAFLER